MLEIMGESMIEAGILDGDYVIVKKCSTANNGEIVVAMTEDDEATVKRFYKEKTYFRLQPENSSMEPIIVNQVTILGKVVGLYRNVHWLNRAIRKELLSDTLLFWLYFLLRTL